MLRAPEKLNKGGDIGTVFSDSTEDGMGRLGAGIPGKRTRTVMKKFKSLPQFL